MTNLANQQQSRRNALKTITLGIGAGTFLPLMKTSANGNLLIKPAALKDPVYYSSATAIAAAIRKKEISSEDITRIYIERIKEVNPKINAVVQLAEEMALNEAKKADQELARGEYRGPLHGVPFTIKDAFETKDIITTFGTLGRKNYVPDYDASVVARLKSAGAILLGKTNTPELALSSYTSNLVYGTTRNPYNTERSPGATSGGSGANMAAGGAAFEIGSDIGGSVRLPAHFCGICSLKPTSGRVSRHGFSGSFYDQSQDMSCVGPMARYVEDLITLFPIISGPDGIDPFISELPVYDPNEVDVSKLRYAWYTDHGAGMPLPEIISSIRRAVKIIASAGATTEETRPGEIARPWSFLKIMLLDKGYAIHRILQEAGTEKISDNLTMVPRDIDFETATVPVKDIHDAFRTHHTQKSRLTAFFSEHDIIICPASHVTAPGAEVGKGWYFSYIMPYNIANWPAAVIPAGITGEGLPYGIQIVGKPWQEHKVLAVAKFLEKKIGGFQPPGI